MIHEKLVDFLAGMNCGDGEADFRTFSLKMHLLFSLLNIPNSGCCKKKGGGGMMYIKCDNIQQQFIKI